jgi:hypothetical protein
MQVTGSCGSVLSVGARLTVTGRNGRPAAEEGGAPTLQLSVAAWPNPTTGRLQVRVTGAGKQSSVKLRLYTLMQRVAGEWTMAIENGGASKPWTLARPAREFISSPWKASRTGSSKR